MKTATKKPKSQKLALLSYLKRNRRGITVMEAFTELRTTCVHKRISDLECMGHTITRTPERTASGSIVTRYKLAR